MAESVGEVGAAFFLEDRASGPLTRIGEAFDKVQGMLDRAAQGAEAFSKVRFTGLTQSLGTLIDRLDVAESTMNRIAQHNFAATEKSIGALTDSVMDLGVAADLAQQTFTSSMARIIGETSRATTEMHQFVAATAAAANASAGFHGGPGGPGQPPPGPPPGRRGGGGGGGHGITAGGLYHYGGFSALMFNPYAMIGGMAGYYAIDEAAKYDLAVRNTVMALGADPDSAEGRAMVPVIQDTITKSTVGTIFDKKDVAETGVGFASIYGSAMPRDHPDQALSPMDKAQRVQGIERTVMQFAETEKQMGKGSLDENVEAGVFMAHLTRQYSPETLGPTLDRLLSISRMTGKTPMEIERTMKYSVTTGGLGGVDPSDIMTSTGFLMQSGITGTTAGTGLAALMQSIYEGGGPDKKSAVRRDENQDRRELMRALHGTISLEKPEHRGVKINERRQGLIEMGIIDPSGKPMPGMADSSGNLKLLSVIDALSKFADDPHHDKLALAHMETKVFGTRGARAEEPFMGREQLQLFKQYREMETQFTQKLGVDTTQKRQAESPMQEFQQTLARGKDLMLETVLPALEGLGHAAKSLADVFEVVTKFMHEHSLLGKVITDAVMGAVGGAAIGTIVPGVGTGVGAIIGGTGGALGGLMGGAPTYGSGGSININPFSGMGSMEVHPDGHPAGWPKANPHFAPRASPSAFHTDGSGTHVEIHNISLGGGSAREQVDEFLSLLARRLSRSSLHDLGTGSGHLSSGYSVGRTVSI